MVTNKTSGSGLLLKVTTSYSGPAYEKLQFYKNICEIRRAIYKITENFKKSDIRLIQTH
jgi:hypothetical protein